MFTFDDLAKNIISRKKFKLTLKTGKIVIGTIDDFTPADEVDCNKDLIFVKNYMLSEDEIEFIEEYNEYKQEREK